MNAQDMINLNKYESELLDVMYNQDNFDTSDLQGVIQAIVYKIYNYGLKQGVNTLSSKMLEYKDISNDMIDALNYEGSKIIK